MIGPPEGIASENYASSPGDRGGLPPPNSVRFGQGANSTAAPEWDAERFSRLEMMIGCEGMRRLAASSVAVVGLGAVGSYAVEALARAGIGRLRLVDFDIVRPCNANRQLYALHSTIGRRKADVARERVLDINPKCEVEALAVFAHSGTAAAILTGPPDVLVDAIDSVGPKVEILAAAATLGIKTVSCMGAALRTDPSLVRIGPLSETKVCPLAKHIRKRLKARGVSADRIVCVYSIESAGDLSREAADSVHTEEQEFMGRGRARRPLGSLPTLTGIFGLVAANEVLRLLLGAFFPGGRAVRHR